MTLGGTAATGVTVTPPNTINATTGAHAAGLVDVVVTNPDSQSGTLTNGYTYIAPPPAPTITSFSPTSGPVGTSVTINGTNFTGATAVKFKGTSASFTVNTSIKITATVPAGASTGKISVTTPGGTATSANNFTVKQHASFTSEAAAVHLEAGLAHPGGIGLMQTSETQDRLPVERFASLGLWQRDTDSHATGLTFSNIRFGSEWAGPGDSGLSARIMGDVGFGSEAVSTASAEPAAIRPQAVSSLGRRYSFYSPEMNLLAETEIRTSSGTPAILYEYVWFNGHPVAQVDAGTTTHWTFTDHLGTPLIQTDTAGAVYWRAEHEPYGSVFALRTADQHQPLRLPGQEAEQLNLGPNGATERSYNIFRWYRPSWGRYTQPDPAGTPTFQEPDPYVYVQANPIRVIDPVGLFAVDSSCDCNPNYPDVTKGIAKACSYLKKPACADILKRFSFKFGPLLPCMQERCSGKMPVRCVQRSYCGEYVPPLIGGGAILIGQQTCPGGRAGTVFHEALHSCGLEQEPYKNDPYSSVFRKIMLVCTGNEF